MSTSIIKRIEIALVQLNKTDILSFVLFKVVFCLVIIIERFTTILQSVSAVSRYTCWGEGVEECTIYNHASSAAFRTNILTVEVGHQFGTSDTKHSQLGRIIIHAVHTHTKMRNKRDNKHYLTCLAVVNALNSTGEKHGASIEVGWKDIQLDVREIPRSTTALSRLVISRSKLKMNTQFYWLKDVPLG